MVNTPGLGFARRVESISQALAVLGRQQLQRWLQILLYAAPSKSSSATSPLLGMATTRGRLLELIASKSRPGDRAISEIAFTVGIMSLMDTLFNAPMQEILDKISVPPEVADALLHRSGFLGEALKIAECIERIDELDTVIKPLIQKWQLTPNDMTELQVNAFNWSDSIVRATR